MTPTEPLPLFHSWPLLEAGRRFELGRIDDPATPGALPTLDDATRARHGLGRWECDLADNSLTWSPEVYDLFGLPPGATLSRTETAARYAEPSRAAMERLRAYAIQHRRGFTLDAEIRTADGSARWMRLIAAPLCVDDRVVRLVGVKRALA